jgi:uncharacterized protein
VGKRLVIYLVGLIITAFGIAMIILSSVGAGPWDTVAVGLNKHLGLTIGMWSIISQGMVVLLTGVIERKRLQYGSVVAILIRSAFLDAWLYLVFSKIDLTSSWEIQWLSFVIGVMAVGVGIGIYVEADLPKSPIDGLMIALMERFGWSLNVSRIMIESSAVLMGFLLGGPVGVGTIMIAIMLGKIVQISNGSVKKILSKQKMAA